MPESEASSVLKGQTPSTGFGTVPESKVLSVIKGQSPSTVYGWYLKASSVLKDLRELEANNAVI